MRGASVSTARSGRAGVGGARVARAAVVFWQVGGGRGALVCRVGRARSALPRREAEQRGGHQERHRNARASGGAGARK